MDADRGSFLEDDDVALEVRGLWKVSGRSARQMIRPAVRSAGKDASRQLGGNVTVLRDISFKVNRGEIFVVFGLAGSGKSTLIRCILRLVEPTAGKVLFNGEDICRYSGQELTDLHRYTTGVVFKQFGLFPHRSVLDNAAYGLKVRGMDREKRYQRARQAIARMGIQEWEGSFPPQLPPEVQQRAAIARALTNDPDILLMDEPFGLFEPVVRHGMQDELLTLQAEMQKTILLTTDDLDEALKLGNRVAIMKEGEFIQVGTPEEVITAPKDATVWELVQDASPARVVTAGSIMEQPNVLLYEWQGPKVALHILKTLNLDEAFLLTHTGKLVGLVTTERLVEVIQRRGTSLKEAIDPDTQSCTPDMVVEELFPLAVSGRYPIPVVDERGKFLGEIHTSTILFSMIQETVVGGESEGGK